MEEHKSFTKILGQIKNRNVLVIILIVGITLMLLPFGGKEQTPMEPQKQEDAETYRQTLETRLTKILSSAKGVGSVQVMITLEHEGQTFYAADEKNETSAKNDTQERATEATYVLKKDDSGTETPMVSQKNMPAVSGVLILAKGAEDPAVKAEIIRAVRAVLGVKSHRIEVLAKQ